jgi:hypothetical protein
MLIMLIYIPLIRASEGVVFGNQPDFGTMGKFFEDTFSGPVTFFVVLAALMVPQTGKDREIHPEFLLEEFMLLACLFLSPILVNLYLIHRQKGFSIAIASHPRQGFLRLSRSFLPTASG